ncbi:hypothetical protein [Prosthecobacter vanneervenii]|uniref:Uncharacterized protein n=1 Tax=Prosthecobacter vanneervenii TaxID=48466 RepID=A0A7W7Y8H0_9BACT|nr:hypothetical protein [Prosthecobacter vanneervenii]MBB5031567.1 hypothetical protein [Prosthecobacter vanneervenii]
MPATTWAKQARQIVIRRWQPEPLSEPVIDEELPNLSAIERSAEVISFTCRRAEYWLSPQGTLREWLKFNLRLAIGIAVPALLVAPLVTLALERFNLWIDLISKSTSNFVLVPLSVLLVVGLIAGLVSIAKSILSMRLRHQQRRDPYNY